MRQPGKAGKARGAVRGWFLPEQSPRRGDTTFPRPAVTEALPSCRLPDIASKWLGVAVKD